MPFPGIGASGPHDIGNLGTLYGTVIFQGGDNITLSQVLGTAGSHTIVISGPAGGTPMGAGVSNLGNTLGTSGTVQQQYVYVGGNNITLSQSVNGQSATLTIIGSHGQDTMGMSNLGNTLGTSGVVSGSDIRVLFAGGDNITLSQSINGGSATITVIGPSGVAETPFGVSAGTQSVSTGTLVFSNSNGLSFGMSGSSRVTGSYSVPVVSNAIQAVKSATGSGTNTSRFAPDDHAHEGVFSIGVSTEGNTLGDTVVQAGQMVLVGGNSITLSQRTAAGKLATIEISGPSAAGETPFGISAGTQSVSTGTLVYSNSHNITFGMSGSSRITASASFPSETPFGLSAGTQSVSTGTLIFSDSNGISFGMSGSSRITASYTVPTETPFGISGGTQSVSTGTLVFSNSNNVTFGMSGSSRITASASFPSETPFGLSAGTQSVSTGTMIFSDSNGISFGMSGSSRITASYTVPTETPFGLSAGTQSVSTGTLIFSDSNGISFGMSGSSRITASYTVPTETPFGLSAGTQSISTGTLVFSNSNNVTFGMSGSSRVTASASFPSETPFGISAGTQSISTGTLIFSDSNGISFGMSGSSRVTASYTVPSVPVVSNALQDVGTATGSGTNTSRFAADDHIHRGQIGWDVNGIASTFFGTQQLSAGAMMSIATGGGSTRGTAQFIDLWSSATTASRIDSANAIGAMASRVALEGHQHAGLWAIDIAGNTSGGNTSSGAGSLRLAGGAGITLSGATAAGGMTITISAGTSKNWFNNAAGGPATSALAGQATSNGTLFVFPLNAIEDDWGDDMTVNTAMINISGSHTNTSGSTAAKSYSFFLGVYTSANSTQLSLLNSVSVSHGTNAAASGQSASWNGPRFVTIHSSQWSSQPVFKNGSRYMMGFFVLTAGEAFPMSVLGQYMHRTEQRSGTFGSSVATNTSMGWGPWQGLWSASTAALPGSIARSSVQKNNAAAYFIPNLIFNNEASSF